MPAVSDPGENSENDSSDVQQAQPQQNAKNKPRVPVLPTPWDDECAERSFDPSWNSHGVVHVRLLYAKHLPCPVGSSVCAIVSLPPYKGRVRSKRKSAFSSSLEDGVCVRWSRERNGDDLDNDDPDDTMDDHDHDDDGLCSMVNGWSSEDSPIPSIKIDLMFSPLGIGLFDFTMASVDLSCAVLMKNAGSWRTCWCSLHVPDSLAPGSGIDRYDGSNGSKHHHTFRCPLIQIQAVFAPSIPVNRAVSATAPLSPMSSSTGALRNQDEKPPLSSFLMETLSSRGGNSEDDKLSGTDKSMLKVVLPQILENEDNRQPVEARLQHGEGPQIQVTNDDANNDETDLESINMDIQEEHNVPGIATGVQQEQEEGSLASKATQAVGALDPHLLRSETYWIPASCAVCSRVLFGRHGGFHCEQCGIECCSDCRLNVDLRVPCGSDLAGEIVAKSLQRKLNISNLLSVIAPDEAFEQKMIVEESRHNSRESVTKSFSKAPSGVSMARSPAGSGTAISSLLNEGEEFVGRFSLEIGSACIFQQVMPAWSDVPSSGSSSKPAVRKGDYYVRVSTTDSEKTARTPTLQNTGMPKFQAMEMNFPLSHYGVQFRIDVVDANAEMVVGSALLTTQGILQEQRDLYISKHGASIVQFLHGPIRWVGKRKLKLELRSGIKSMSGNDYFSLPPKSNASKGLIDQVGSISGWIEVSVGVEEFTDRLYGQNPVECPNRPPPDLNVTNFSVHVARIKAIFEDIEVALRRIKYMTSWENPALTTSSLYIFVTICLRFNAEYSGSLPFLLLLIVAAYCAIRRSQGQTKSRYIRREIESIQRVEGGSVGYTVHRPRGIVSVTVSNGRDLLSRDLGIAGKVSCRIFWDSTRYADDTTRKEIIVADKSAEVPLEIGCTPTLYTANPDWSEMVESTATKRLKQLIPSPQSCFFESPFETDADRLEELSFPVLQPFHITGRQRDEKSRLVDGKLKQWESSKGAIVMQINFEDFLNTLPGFGHTLGEVVFPFSELVSNQEVKGWFQILDVGSDTVIPLDATDVDEEAICGITQTVPRIYLHLKWSPPLPTSETSPNDSEREISYAVQEELVRSITLSKEQKFDLVGSSIGAVNTAIGIGGTVQIIQNTLGSVLDGLEAGINAFNFTDPFKSSIIFGAIFLIWLVLIIVPTRFLVLAAGVAKFGVTFLERFGKDFGLKPKPNASDAPRRVESQQLQQMDRAMPKKSSKPNPVAVWITNAIRSLPTNEDLRKAYFWESQRQGAHHMENFASEKRISRLEKLWKARWHSSVKILIQFEEREGNEYHHPTTFYRLEQSFAVVQGHRFLWWNTVQDFDGGELPAGKLFLSGHAGLGGPSPLEMKILSKDELPLCLSIFGRGGDGQARVTMLLPDVDTKEALEIAVIDSSDFKRD